MSVDPCKAVCTHYSRSCVAFPTFILKVTFGRLEDPSYTTDYCGYIFLGLIAGVEFLYSD